MKKNTKIRIIQTVIIIGGIVDFLNGPLNMQFALRVIVGGSILGLLETMLDR